MRLKPDSLKRSTKLTKTLVRWTEKKKKTQIPKMKVGSLLSILQKSRE